MYKTKYALLHHSQTYTCTNVYIGIQYMYVNRTTFIKAQETQSVEHSTTNLKDVGSSLDFQLRCRISQDLRAISLKSTKLFVFTAVKA